MAEPDGAAIYGIWHCIVGACSQQKKRNGWLTADGDLAGSPWGVEDMALKFRRPQIEVERALQVLVSEKVGWIIVHGNSLLTADSPPAHLEEKEEKERREEKEGAPALSEIPSWEEFWEFCKSPHCGIAAEWFAKDKFLAVDDWTKKRDWKKYALRVRGWWDNDGRPITPPQKNGSSNGQQPQNRISQEQELNRVCKELGNYSTNLSDYNEISTARKRIIELRQRRKELREALGVIA